MAILAFQKPDKVVMLERQTNSASSNFVLWSQALALPSVTHCAAFFFHRLRVMLSTQSVFRVLSMSFPLYLA